MTLALRVPLPIRGKPLHVVGVQTMTERVAHHLVLHYPGVPGSGQTLHALVPARGLVHRAHAQG